MSNQLKAILLLTLLLTAGLLVLAEPEGAVIDSSTTETPAARSAGSLTTAGGSFTTLVLNATSQTQKWKAYVGNISGTLALRDSTNLSIYRWDLTTITGEVYASRNASINWTNIDCVQNSTLNNEETELNIDNNAVDSINETFNTSIHKQFYVGTTQIPQSSCRAIATYVNDQAQTPDVNADFQLILLEDQVSMVYATLLEDSTAGYDNSQFDFQMIVAEDPTVTTPNTYYFWAELG